MEISEFSRRLYICPGDSTPVSTNTTLDILASRKIHTRGNSDTETLLTVDNPERILRNRNKEKLDSPLFDTSSSQYLYGLTEPEWGVGVERLLTNSKSESDLRKSWVDPNTLQSYLLDSFWLNLETPPKSKEIAPIFQNT